MPASGALCNTVVKGPGKRGHIVADTLLLMMFLVLRKLHGNISCGHKMFLNKIRNIFCVPDTKFVSANVAFAGKRETFVSATDVRDLSRKIEGDSDRWRLCLQGN